jgi:hypothetical protein
MVDINEKGETEYWKLHKALYGPKQACHEWYQMLRQILHDTAGLEQYIGDKGCYVGSQAIIVTHVDDILGVTPKNKGLNDIDSERKVENYVELEK